MLQQVKVYISLTMKALSNTAYTSTLECFVLIESSVPCTKFWSNEALKLIRKYFPN